MRLGEQVELTFQMGAPDAAQKRSLPRCRSATGQVSAARCAGANVQPGQRIWARGYLAVPSGTYSLNASMYSIWLEDRQLTTPRLTVKIPGGNKRNSMYFANGKSDVNDGLGQIIPWMTQGGREICVTNRLATIRGTWIEECSVRIEEIE